MDTELITIFPNKVSKNSLILINYSDLSSNAGTIYLEYSYKPFNDDTASIEKIEMHKNGQNGFVYFNVGDSNELYFRISDDYGIINDHYGSPYTVTIEESSAESYTDSIQLINAYNKYSNKTLAISSKDEEKEALNLYSFDFSMDSGVSDSLALVPLKDTSILYVRHGLRFSYRLNKRIKLILLKLFRQLPSFITGNYRRRINL